MPNALLYHDVTPHGRDDASGFPGPGAARYKLTPEMFRAHLDAIAGAVSTAPLVALDALARPQSVASWLLTFDDGGVSSLVPIADLLEAKGWRGHFFITTNCLDRPTFVTRQQVRELHRRGHVIGSHSCSHPERFSACSWEQMVREWRQSRAELEEILGAPVMSASVPGGFYTCAVARAAAVSGLKVLFNSEPTTRVFAVEGCLVVGRYSIVRGMSAAAAAALAKGDLLPRWRQSASWKLRKLAKATGGTMYLRLRSWLLGRAYGNNGGRPPNQVP